MTVSCPEVLEQLWDYLDGELPPERMSALESHILHCANCYPQYRYELAFLAAVASQRDAARPPRTLVERLEGMIRSGREGGGTGAADPAGPARHRRPESNVAWIPTDQPAEPGGLLARVTAEVRRARGSVANIFAVHSIHPEIMRSHLRLYRDLMFGPSDLSREERETIALAVSVVNEADYCIHHHGAALCELTGEAQLVDAVLGDPEGAPLDERRRCLVRYALKLTRKPTSVLEGDILEMRAAGLSDRAIHDAAAITAYFNFVNRLALGLGVRLEPHDGW